MCLPLQYTTLVTVYGSTPLAESHKKAFEFPLIALFVDKIQVRLLADGAAGLVSPRRDGAESGA